MRTKIVLVAVGLLFLLPPLTASAQTTGLSNSLIAALTQLVQLLEQELQQLISLHDPTVPLGNPKITTQPVVTFIASATLGEAPLQVFFTGPQSADGDTVTFGDNTSGTMGIVIATCVGTGDENCGVKTTALHTYQSAGTYTATLLNASSTPLSTVTITVFPATSGPHVTSATVNESGYGPFLQVGGYGFSGNSTIFLIQNGQKISLDLGHTFISNAEEVDAGNGGTLSSICTQSNDFCQDGTFSVQVETGNSTSNVFPIPKM